jgi:hypothetical protein
LSVSDSSDAHAAAVTRGGTRFRRAGLLFIPAMVGVLALVLGTLFGVLPLNLYLTGQDFKLSSNGEGLTADGLTAYPTQVRMKFDGKTYGVANAVIKRADLPKGLCISLTLKVPVLGRWTVQIHTSGDTVAHDLTLGAVNLNALTATLRGSSTNGKPLAANGSNVNPLQLGPSVAGGAGLFGVSSPGANQLVKVEASGKSAVIAGKVNLRGVTVNVHRGTKGSCF